MKILLFILLSLVLISVFISALMYSPTYMYRIFRYRESEYYDFLMFPERKISSSKEPFIYKCELSAKKKTIMVSYEKNGDNEEKELESFLEDSDTTAFIVIRGDEVFFEGYYNGFERDSVNTSFSLVKSILSLLIGLAIDEGYIGSEEESIAHYITEFKDTEFESITIKDLLLMRSPIRYFEGLAWIGDDAKTYYMPDLRDLALNRIRFNQRYEGRFHYNNYHPLLLGIILERSTAQNVSSFMEEQLWTRLGTEFPASWSLDSKEHGFEKMESGFNYRSIDMAKVGSMLLNHGIWQGREIISKRWLKRSLYASFPLNPEDYLNSFLEGRSIGYQYMWYSQANEKGGYDFFASGKFDQYLYVSPENNVVIVRNGKTGGGVENWYQILKSIAYDIGETNGSN